MRLEGMLKVSAAMMAVGMVGLAGCGGQQAVKPVETPMAAAPAPTPEPTPAPQRYTVVKGDTLWGIAGQSGIYGDNFQWPLVFKANRDQIQDPDIIEVNQDFSISKEFTPEEVQTAIENAKKTPRYKHHTKPRKHLPIEY